MSEKEQKLLNLFQMHFRKCLILIKGIFWGQRSRWFLKKRKREPQK